MLIYPMEIAEATAAAVKRFKDQTPDLRTEAALPDAPRPRRTSGGWGALDAPNGVLVGDDGTRRLSGPVRIDGAKVTGEGWTVTVARGWVVEPGPRSGDFQIIRDKQQTTP